MIRYMDTTRYAATHNLLTTLQRRERSRGWLARKVGVSESLMRFVVGGSRTISADKAFRAAAVLDEPVEYLFRPVKKASTRKATDTRVSESLGNAIGDEREGPDPDEMLSPDDEAYWDAQDALRDELEGVA